MSDETKTELLGHKRSWICLKDAAAGEETSGDISEKDPEPKWTSSVLRENLTLFEQKGPPLTEM